MIKIGQKVSFDPWHGINSVLGSSNDGNVEGKVVYVNPKHNWFEVEYKMGDGKFKSSFNFCDVFGEDAFVRLVRS